MTKKNALITGGSRGLGLEVARLLAGKDYRVTTVGRNAESLDAAVSSFPGEGHRVWAFDLSQRSQTCDLIHCLADESFDLLINNAGASRFGAFAELTPQAVEELIYLNFTAPALIARQFLQNAPPQATLVNVTSIVGTLPMPGNGLYCAAKAGLKTLSECLWFEARRKGVRVLDFCPFSLKTDFHRLAGGDSLAGGGMAIDPAQATRALVNGIERGREFAYPHGKFVWILGLINRLLPRKLLISLMGKKSLKAGYLAPYKSMS
jgi:uncharacterized protein